MFMKIGWHIPKLKRLPVDQSGNGEGRKRGALWPDVTWSRKRRRKWSTFAPETREEEKSTSAHARLRYKGSRVGAVEPAFNVTPQHARKSQRLAGSACLTDQEGVLMAVVCRTAGCMLHRDDGSPGFMQKEARHRGPRVSSRTPSLRLLGIKIVKMKLCNRTKNIS